MQQNSEALSFEQFLGVLRRRLPVIALCVLAVAGAAFAFSKHQTKEYTATGSLVFNNNSLSQQIAGLPASGAGSSELLIQQANNLELVRGGDVAVRTARVVGHGLTPRKVSNGLSVSTPGESGVIAVSATSTSPLLAALIVNTYARQFVKEQQSANRRYFKSALAIVDKQLAALPLGQRNGPAGLQLQNRAQTLAFLAELRYGNVQVAQRALPPSSPSSPKTSKNTALGMFLGLVLGIGLAFAFERLDRRIRRPDDFETIYRLPLLGVVPKSAALSRSASDSGGKRAALPPAEAEAFGLICAHLRFFNPERDLRTVVIASAAPGDGKTTVARHLAEEAARRGLRVLLLEADLRHPVLGQQLDIQSGAGLADVLIRAIPMDAATQAVELAASPGNQGAEGRTLNVLTAGEVPAPNSAELLESDEMDAVLERAKSTYDFVIIDTPSLTVVSDAFPLLTKVDGVVIVGWVGRSRRDAAEQLHQVLAGSEAPLLGVIVNGSQSARLDVYAKDHPPTPTTPSANSKSTFQTEALLSDAKT